MARAYRSAEQWRTILEGQASSGLSIGDYCHQQGISVSGFYGWKKKLAPIEASTDDWIALAGSTERNTTSWDMELSLPGGVVLRIRQSPC